MVEINIRRDCPLVNIAVLIPCYNEQKTLTKVVEDFRRELLDAGIYVFDNNSTDGNCQREVKGYFREK